MKRRKIPVLYCSTVYTYNIHALTAVPALAAIVIAIICEMREAVPFRYDT
jgi:hypothetical protein